MTGASGLRLDYVSPLPPVRSGIADYGVDLLPHLAARADVRVVALPGQPLSDEVRAAWSPVPASEVGAGGRLPLYQMGNNRHHREVLELALEHPGVVTLHDLVLHHLLVEVTLGEAKLDPYLEALERDHGWVGRSAALARQWGELGAGAMFHLPVHRTLLGRQRGVLVHSRWAAEMLEEEDPDLAVRVVPMAVPLPPEPSEEARRAFRERLGVAEGTTLVGSFGFQTPIKRTDRVIEALARPELENAHLVVAGEVSPSLDLEGLARRLGVADRVHLVGFLDGDEFGAAIAACDLCANLRYPTAGETSASLLRILALGTPAMVSDYAQFAELPSEVVVKTPLGDEEVDALASGLGALAADPARLAAMGVAAREHVRRAHDPEAAAAAVVEACGELRSFDPPGDRARVEPPPTTNSWNRLEGELTVEGGSEPWPVGARRRLRLRLSNHGDAVWLSHRHLEGGVLVEAQWRDTTWGETVERRWKGLPRNVEPGQTLELDLEVRRPPGAAALIVEPHVAAGSGFDALGGPRWIGEFGS